MTGKGEEAAVLAVTTVGEAVRVIERLLRAAEIEAARLEARLLLAHTLELSPSQVFMYPERALELEARERLASFLDRRLKREPMAHILGQREFWGMTFTVSSAVLTPRPDSETLIEAVLAAFPDRAAALRCLDLGTGSGCLLLSILSEYSAAHGVGVDISQAALDVAKANAVALGLSQRASFLVGSWDDGIDESFDLILSNPPYIKDGDRVTLDPDVVLYEPHQALFAGKDGLDCYRALAPVLVRRLRTGGMGFLELGIGQAEDVAALCRNAGLNVVGVKEDLGGIERCLIVRKEAL